MTNRTLVLSDIHGNIAALRTIAARERFDEVICLGDIVGYGPAPGACLRWLRRQPLVAIQGNHDRALGDRVAPGCRPQFEWFADATFPLGRLQLTGEERAYLASLPRRMDIVREGVRYALVHATPHDPLYAYLGNDPEAWAEQVAEVDTDVLLVGHTHVQFDIQLGGKRVINPGSVGQPKDGDPRAAYAVLEAGVVRLARVAYPVDRTIRALGDAGVAPAVVHELASLLRTGTPPAPHAIVPPP